MTEVIAVAAALGAAMIYASAAVLEYRSAKQVPARGPLEVRLLADLARRPADRRPVAQRVHRQQRRRHAVEVLSLAVMAGGIIALAQRAPQAAQSHPAFS